MAHFVRIEQVSKAARMYDAGEERERRLMVSSQKGRKFLKNDVVLCNNSEEHSACCMWPIQCWHEYARWGGNSIGDPTRQVGDFSVAESRILEVTDVELEPILHASE